MPALFPGSPAAAPAIQSAETALGLRRAPAGGGILTPFPSATAVALALGVRLTLRGLTLRRNPWTCGARVSHPRLRYSCQHSRFRCLQPASRPAFTGLRNAPLPRSEDRSQKSDITTAATQAPEHPGNLPEFALPALGHIGPDITKIAAIHSPYPHRVGRPDRHHQEATKTLGQVGADRVRRPPHLIGQRKLLDPREFAARPVHFQRQPVGSPEHIEILDPRDPLAHFVCP